MNIWTSLLFLEGHLADTALVESLSAQPAPSARRDSQHKPIALRIAPLWSSVMNIYKNLLFLNGHLADPGLVDDDDQVSYAQGYGNRIASDKFFGTLGHKRPQEARELVGELPCVVGGCG